MQKRKFTVVTQLHEKNNQDIIEYIESSRSIYAKAVRETFIQLSVAILTSRNIVLIFNINTVLSNEQQTLSFIMPMVISIKLKD